MKTCDYCTHVEMCGWIEEVKEQGCEFFGDGMVWIPVSERMPEEDTEVIVSCTDDSGDSEFSYTTTGWHFKGVWVVGNERSYFVRAWMPLPEAFKGEQG